MIESTSNQTFWSGAVIRRLSVPANVSKPWWVKVFDNINNFHVPEIGAMMTKISNFVVAYISKVGSANSQHFVVATQDYSLR